MSSSTKQKPSLSENLEIGNTILNVGSISTLQDFYQDSVGLEVLSKESNEVILGHGDKRIISLSKTKDLTPSSPTSAGLYHNAVVYQSRGQLAHTLRKLFTDRPDSFIGSADHYVSEAFYFRDPEGNELELYYDKDRSLWEWDQGRVRMGVEYIDPMSYIYDNSQEEGSSHKQMGHVHLKVGDIEQAKKFYVDTLGFDITAELPQALFVSVGGYHHHIGMNSWHSIGTGPRTPSLGLQSIELKLPSKKDVDNLLTRLDNNNITLTQKGDTISFADPWNNIIHVNVK